MKNRKGILAMLSLSNLTEGVVVRKASKLVLVCLALGAGWGWAVDGKPLSVEDIMRFREIKKPAIQADGHWVTYLSTPDRGDAEGVAVRIRDGRTFRVSRGSKLAVSKDGKWVVVLQKTAAIAMAKAGKDKRKKENLKGSLVIINVKSGDREEVPQVKDFGFSDDGTWLAIHLEAIKTKDTEEGAAKEKPKKDKKKKVGTPLQLRHLGAGSKTTIAAVLSFEFSPEKTYLTWVKKTTDGVDNGLYARDLREKGGQPNAIITGDHVSIPKLVFSKKGEHLAFLMSPAKGAMPTAEAEASAGADASKEAESELSGDDAEKKAKAESPKSDPRHLVYIWPTGKEEAQRLALNRANWYIPKESVLTWSVDGKRLFFGFKPDFKLDQPKDKPAAFSEANFWATERILKDRGLDVWHGNDPFIKSYDKTNWKRISKQDYLAVYHLEGGYWTSLADRFVPSGRSTDHPNSVLLSSDLPYRRAATWAGQRRDVWLADLDSGDKFKVAEGLVTRTWPSVSPSGQSVVFYQDGHYHLFSRDSGTTRNLTATISPSFANEDHDYPAAVPGYGIAGWLEDDSAVLIYDKYDIWVVPLTQPAPYCLTAGDGRARKLVYRLIDTDPDKLWYAQNEKLLLSAYYDLEKHSGFYRAKLGASGVTQLLQDRKTFRFIAKAEDADRILFTREDFHEFPNLWVARTDLEKLKKITEENPQIKDFAWGEPELVSWASADGKPLQGILIKPGNYQPGRRYPVLVYYYRFYSQRMYRFNQMVINHRPNFPLYTSNGYAVFLPDIRFDVGLPGPAAVKCLVPGVQKIIDMGIADPNGIGLHGHSWSGYQTAFVITQTHIFKAAVAGAPVTNMTSAYSGIRLGSGLARQFQYEMGQSRIGGSLWQNRDLYIENSPVFFADRIQTPLLMQFGDKDGAVPWQQGIELYLALRRLDKEVVFLQYHDEPHHLKQYANKLDYTLKMKAYFDHYLKGEPAESWISEGVAYDGEITK